MLIRMAQLLFKFSNLVSEQFALKILIYSLLPSSFKFLPRDIFISFLLNITLL